MIHPGTPTGADISPVRSERRKRDQEDLERGQFGFQGLKKLPIERAFPNPATSPPRAWGGGRPRSHPGQEPCLLCRAVHSKASCAVSTSTPDGTTDVTRLVGGGTTVRGTLDAAIDRQLRHMAYRSLHSNHHERADHFAGARPGRGQRFEGQSGHAPCCPACQPSPGPSREGGRRFAQAHLTPC